MEVSSQKRLSLDTNVLFDLAEGQDFASDFRESYQRKGYALLLPPTAAAELYFALEHGDNREERLATIAISSLSKWDIRAAALTTAQIRAAHIFAAQIRSAGLLPRDEINDSCIIGETAILGIPLIVSADHHILDVDFEKLRTLCVDASHSPVVSASPRGLLRAL
jgi:predicted nucleic acid-binding protein